MDLTRCYKKEGFYIYMKMMLTMLIVCCSHGVFIAAAASRQTFLQTSGHLLHLSLLVGNITSVWLQISAGIRIPIMCRNRAELFEKQKGDFLVVVNYNKANLSGMLQITSW